MIIWACVLLILSLAALMGPALALFSWARVRFHDAAERWVFAAAAALGLLGYLVFVLGSARQLSRPLWLAILGALAGVSARRVLLATREAWAVCSKEGREADWIEKAGWALFALAGFACWAGAVAPAIGQDELCYHLGHPLQYVRAGRIDVLPYATSGAWPYLAEMWFTLGVILQGAELGKLFHFTTWLLTAAALVSLGRRTGQRRAGVYAALIYTLTPAVFAQAAFAYVDNALACFVFLFAYAFWVYVSEADLRWAAVAGVFAGLAASTKLLGLYVLPIAVVWGFVELFLSKKKRALCAGIPVFAAAAVLFGAVWYVRSWMARGNPFFPFYPEWFGGHGWHDPTYTDVHGAGRRGLMQFLAFPWGLTVRPDDFGGEKIGVLYLIFAPLILRVRPIQPVVKRLLFASVLYAVIWFRLEPNARFFFPALAFLALPAAAAVSVSEKSVRTTFALVLAAQAFWAPVRFRDEIALVFRGDRDRYLRTHERSYATALRIDKMLKPGDKILSLAEPRGYYFKRPFVLEGDFTRFTGYERKVRSISELGDLLRREGFTHVLDTDLRPGGEEVVPEWRLTRVARDASRREGLLETVAVFRSSGVRYTLYKVL